MRIFSLFWLEFRRLLRSPITWLIMGLTILSPIMGLFLYQPVEATTLGTYLANPSLAAGIFSSLLFAFLTVWEWDRVKRGQMEALLYSVVSPLTASCIRLLSLIGTASLTWSITVAVWMPFTMMASGSIFDGLTYFLCYFLFMGMAMPISILLSSAAYQFTRRMDLSIVILAALAGLSLTIWKDNWQLCWLNPCVWAISDDFTNFRIFRSVAYMRFTWIIGATAIWLLSYLCIRQYGKGPVGSMQYSSRHFWRPMITVCLFAFCGFLYKSQPFLDHSNPDLSATALYEIPYLDGVFCGKQVTDVHPNLSRGTVSGTTSFQIENMTGTAQEVAFAINPGYEINSVQANGQSVPFEIDDYQESNMALLNITIPDLESIDLCFDYQGFPQDWNLMETMQGKPEISSKYLCLENQTLAPMIMNVGTADGMFSSITDITLPDTMTVIPFGIAEAKKEIEHDNGTITWRIEDTGTGGILYAGDYVRQDINAAGTSIQFYYGRKHHPIMKEANAVEAIQTVMEYCSSHYGIPSFSSLDSLKLIQGRVAGGGYAVSGASLVDEQDFTTQNLHNSEKGGIPGEVMIHEMVHQWWGLGTMFDVSQPDSAWSAEGLTVYTTYRIIKELYGEAYAKEHYIDQWQTAVDDYYNNFYIRNPQYLEALPEEKRLDISNQLSNMRYYNEMPLKILKAEELLGGEEPMDLILYQLFNRDVDPMYPYLTEQEFLDACKLTEEDLNLD